MEGKNFETSNLKHIKGQEGKVEDPGKAREMAKRENIYHGYADLYETFIADPEKYDQQFKAMFGEGPNLSSLEYLPHQLEYLKKQKVPPEYIRKLGEIDAEVEGSVSDYESGSRNKSARELRLDMLRFWGEGIVLDITRRQPSRRWGRDGEPPTGAQIYAESPEYFSNVAKAWEADRKRLEARRELQRRRGEK